MFEEGLPREVVSICLWVYTAGGIIIRMSKYTLTAYVQTEVEIRDLSTGRNQQRVLKPNEPQAVEMQAPTDIVVFTGPQYPGAGSIVVEPSPEPGIRIVPGRR